MAGRDRDQQSLFAHITISIKVRRVGSRLLQYQTPAKCTGGYNCTCATTTRALHTVPDMGNAPQNDFSHSHRSSTSTTTSNHPGVQRSLYSEKG
eukprot:1821159-Rhodomonas_salina.2